MPWLLLLLACVCPTPPCPGVVAVDVSAARWAPGRWTIDLAGGGLVMTCTVDVQPDVLAPTLADVVCNDLVERRASVLDTAAFASIDVLTLLGRVDPGVRPATARLVVGHDAGAGRVVQRDEEVALTWAQAPARQGTCSEDCAVASLDLPLP